MQRKTVEVDGAEFVITTFSRKEFEEWKREAEQAANPASVKPLDRIALPG